MEKDKRQKDPYNQENRDYRTQLSIARNKRAIDAMQFIGCKSRAVFTEMALEHFIKKCLPE